MTFLLPRRRDVYAALLAILAMLAAAPAVFAQSLLEMDEKLDDVRGWDVGVNHGTNSCLATARYQDKTTVWFGFGGEDKQLFFALANPGWDAIEAGKSYRIDLVASGAGRWHGDFEGVEAGRQMGLVSTGLKEKFMVDIARAAALDVRFKGKSIARLSLSGSMAALGAIIDCQKNLPARSSPPRRAPPQAEAKGGTQEDGASSGTGFFVSESGHILTNNHVVESCKTVQATRLGSVAEPVQVIARDATNDLALLKAVAGPKTVPALAVRTRIGDSVYVYGFPLAGLLATSGNFTIGNVTAVSGLSDDSRMLQISAPVQPGNSGGPLLDRNGNIAGVVVSKLNALRLASVTKDVAQNVNFALKASVAQTFLDGNGILPPLATAAAPAMEPAAIAETARTFTVFIECK